MTYKEVQLNNPFAYGSTRKGKSWSPNPTTTASTCPRWNGKTLRRRWAARVINIIIELIIVIFQLRTAMVKGETGTLSLDSRTSVDKGVSTTKLSLTYIATRRGCFPLNWLCQFTVVLNHFFFFFNSGSQQKRVMFLKNDYYFTSINETPFRFFFNILFNISAFVLHSLACICLPVLLVLVSCWQEDMGSIYSSEMSLLKKVGLFFCTFSSVSTQVHTQCCILPQAFMICWLPIWP